MDYDYDYAEFLWMEEVGQVFRFFFPFFFSFLSEWRKQVFKFERGNNVRESITYRFLIGKIFLLISNAFVTGLPFTTVNSIYGFNNWKRVNNWMRGRKRGGNKGTRFVRMRVLHFTIYLNEHSNLSIRTSLS